LLWLHLNCSESFVYEGFAAFAVALNSCGLLARVPGIFPGMISSRFHASAVETASPFASENRRYAPSVGPG
jgi:hypothetical protein